MDAAMVFRVMSLIPERVARAQSGSTFDCTRVTSHPERIELIARFLRWLGPLDALTKEEQQLLGLRSSGGRPAGSEGEEGAEAVELDEAEDFLDDEQPEPVRLPGAGTQIAA